MKKVLLMLLVVSALALPVLTIHAQLVGDPISVAPSFVTNPDPE